ncbi:MAG: metal-dependent hydrolase [Chloroflexi bacterium]|nr:metal-dependent hydrolase [Chloroflexota bacterium]
MGLTLAVAYGADRLVRRPMADGSSGARVSRLDRLKERLLRPLDYRVVVVAALLADLIDKPLGFWLAPELVNHGTRSFAHTVVFAIALLIAATVATSTWTNRLLVVSLASAWHLVLDQMWRSREIALWPIYGWTFPIVGERAFSEYSGSYLSRLAEFYKEPWELAGAVVILLFVARIVFRRDIKAFIRSGSVG